MGSVFILFSPFWFVYCFDLVLRSALADYKTQLSRRKADASKNAATGSKKGAPMPGPAFYNRRQGSRSSFGMNSLSLSMRSANSLTAASESDNVLSPMDGEGTPKPAPMLGAAAAARGVSAKKLRFSDGTLMKGPLTRLHLPRYFEFRFLTTSGHLFL